MMKKSLGFVLGLFLVSQYAVAGNYGEADTIDEATDQLDSVEQFEKTLEDSPTAAGLTDMTKNPEETSSQAKEPMENAGEAETLQEEPITKPAEQ
jgi:hypothetical protein